MTEQEREAITRFRRLRERRERLAAASRDANTRWSEARNRQYALESELDQERERLRNVGIGVPMAGAIGKRRRIEPDPELIRAVEEAMAETARLDRERTEIGERAQALGQLVDACRREFLARGLDPDARPVWRSRVPEARPVIDYSNDTTRLG